MKQARMLADIGKFLHNGPEDDDLRELLNLIPGAAFWVDHKKSLVLGGNRESLLLTAFTHDELKGFALQKLLPEVSRLRATSLQPIDLGRLRLVQRSGTQANVQASYTPFNREKGWGILQVTREDKQQKATDAAQLEPPIDLDSLQRLLDLLTSMNGHIPPALLSMGQQLTGCETLLLASPDPVTQEYVLRSSIDLDAPTRTPMLPREIAWVANFSRLFDDDYLPFDLPVAADEQVFAASLPVGDDDHFLIARFPAGAAADNRALGTLRDVVALALAQLHGVPSVTSPVTMPSPRSTTIQEGVNDGIVILNKALQIADINHSALKALGYAKEDVLGLDIAELLISPDELVTRIRKAFDSQSSLELDEVSIHRRDGSHYPASLRVQVYPAIDDDQAAVFITDLTSKEEYRQRARQLEQRAMLGEVTAVFAHEVRNPVNNIYTTLQLMKSRLKEDEKSAEQIDVMLENCERLTQLMQSTLTFSRTTELKMREMSVKDLLEGLLMRFQHKLSSEDVRLVVSIPGEVPAIKGDTQALDQVFTNIVTNAIQAMQPREHKTLGVRVRVEQHVVCVDISDTGPGIPEEKRQAIFQPFYTSKSNGTGLGLTITQRIINAHNGQIDVDSFEGGTVFSITLPTIER